jgi:phage terminase small subunit
MTDSPALTPKKLTAKQRVFVAAYLSNGFNATKAAIAAGYSAKTAYSIGSENLRKPEIKAEIDAYLDDATMSAKEVLFRLTQHGRGDIGEVWDEAEGRLDWAKAREKGLTGLIKKVERKTTRLVHRDDPDEDVIEEKVEFHNPQFALHLIGKERGLFVEKNETTLKGEIPVKVYKTFSPDDWD